MVDQLQLGSNVWCVPVKVGPQEVTVKIFGIDVFAILPKDLVAPPWCTHDYAYCAGSLVHRFPYDAVRVDRPFVAKIMKLAPLTLSRRHRIDELRNELMDRAEMRSSVLCTLIGQNRLTFALSLEGNLSIRCDKAPLHEYISTLANLPPDMNSFLPAEGDTLVADVLSISDDPPIVDVDIVAPIERSNRDDNYKLTILPLFGYRSWQFGKSSSSKSNILPSQRPRGLEAVFPHTQDIDNQRNSTCVAVLNDDAFFE